MIIDYGTHRVKFRLADQEPRLVSSSALWLAFTGAERNALSGSAAQRAKALINTLGIVQELPVPAVASILQDLEDNGLIGPGRAAEIANALR